MATQVDIKDRESAKNWIGKAEKLNQTTHDTLTMVNNTLKDVKSGASGTLIDNLVEYSGQAINGFNNVMRGFDGMLNAAARALNLAGEKIGNMVKAVKTAKKIF